MSTVYKCYHLNNWKTKKTHNICCIILSSWYFLQRKHLKEVHGAAFTTSSCCSNGFNLLGFTLLIFWEAQLHNFNNLTFQIPCFYYLSVARGCLSPSKTLTNTHRIRFHSLIPTRWPTRCQMLSCSRRAQPGSAAARALQHASCLAPGRLRKLKTNLHSAGKSLPYLTRNVRALEGLLFYHPGVFIALLPLCSSFKLTLLLIGTINCPIHS